MKVSDTGKGIKKNEMIKLFTLFGKMERTADSNPDGLGMGLTICQKILQRCGGKIEVYSEGENKGSAFFFQIPMSLPHQAHSNLTSSLQSQPALP